MNANNLISTRNLVFRNVHGINPQFLSTGKKFAEVDSNEPKFTKGAYYLGKMVQFNLANVTLVTITF